MREFRNVRLPDSLDNRHLGGSKFELLAPYRAIWSGGEITVWKGFVHDFASIPRIARSIIPQMGNHNGPAVVHDFTYRHHWFARGHCDALFLAAMKVAGVNWLRRNIIYLAVRVGGWVAWNKMDVIST
jgi:hypothetical protein